MWTVRLQHFNSLIGSEGRIVPSNLSRSCFTHNNNNNINNNINININNNINNLKTQHLAQTSPIMRIPHYQTIGSSSEWISEKKSKLEWVRDKRRWDGEQSGVLIDDNCPLLEKRKPIKPIQQQQTVDHPLLFVFLEGLPGSGVQSILHRLSKLQFSTHYLPFPTISLLERTSLQVQPTIHDVRYNAKLLDILELQQNAYQQDSRKFKERLSFIGGSVFAPYLYFRQHSKSSSLNHALQLWNEVKDIYQVALIYCKADAVTLQKRLVEEMFSSGRNEVTSLPEFDTERLSQQIECYSNFFEQQQEDEHQICNAILHTTSTKQAIAALLAFLQITPTFPKFNLDK